MPSRRRKPALGPVIVLAAVLIAGGAYRGLQRDDGGGDAPAERPPIEPADVEDGPVAPPPLDAAGDLTSYRVVYRIEAYGPNGAIVDTEVHEVRRPFEARAETLVGEPPGETPTALSVWAFGVSEIGGIDQARATLIGEPAVPNGEIGLTADLGEALDAGVLVYLAQTQEIAGRTCHRYRTGGPVDVVRLTPPTETDFADLCVDDAGLLLGESWVVDGQLFRRRTAVDVDTSAELDDDRFDPLGEPPEFGAGGGLIGRVTDDSQFPDVDHWALAASPSGFELRGRYTFTPAAAGNVASNTGEQPSVVTGIADVYVMGPEAVIVINGGTNDGRDALGELDGESVVVDELGQAFVRRRVRGAELLVRLPEGRFVKITGSLAVDDLVAIAEDLVRLDGSGATITALETDEELPTPEP